MKGALSIFRFLRAAADQGRRVVLVTLTDVIGRGARAPGAHMGVCEDGTFIGALSSGCVEAAIVAEALAVLEERQSRQVRFGLGSPYLDIRLPCGGGIDLLFTPDPPADQLARLIDLLEARRCASLQLDLGGLAAGASDMVGWSDGIFHVRHHPDPRLVIIGQGREAVSLTQLAWAYTPDVAVFSPDRSVLEDVGAAGSPLLTPSAAPTLGADAYTAIVFLFHDHDWEGDLLCQALATPSFYIGAMGSAATRQGRAEALLARGCSAQAIARVRAPIGLIPAARDPDTLAVSILAQIVQAYAAHIDRTSAEVAASIAVPEASWEEPRRLAGALS
ncbi:XdhC family protein [Sphingomonas sp.]|uniref:XdhC family protein n=1 Tax=Sphingomonas sp. TaxID=28214 RepID=UPI003B3A1220